MKTHSKKNKYGIYFGTLKDDVIISIIKVTTNSRSVKSVTIAANTVSENIWKAIQPLLIDCQITKKDIEFCLINNGPARFNGSRIITLAAKTFAYFSEIPLSKISNLKLHSWFYKKDVILEADAQGYFIGLEKNQNFHELFIKKEHIEQFCQTHELKFEVDEFMTLEQHQQIVLKLFDQFELVEDASKLETNYLRKPINND